MSTLAWLDDATVRTTGPADRDLDLALLRDWPRFGHAAARAYATAHGSGTPVPTTLAASAVALSKSPTLTFLTESPLRPATDALKAAVRHPDAGGRVDTVIAQSLHAALRAAQRSSPGTAAAWLDHTERVLHATAAQPRSTLATSLGHWSLALARTSTTHPVVMIGIAATQRCIAAAARNTLERAVLDGTLDRDTAEPLHRAVSHALTAWAWHQSTLNKGFDPRQPLPVDVLRALGIVQQSALTVRRALRDGQPLGERLATLTAHDLGVASLAARLVSDPLVDAATRETRIQVMASGQLNLIASEPQFRTAEPPQTMRTPSITARPSVRGDEPPSVDPTTLPELTPARERDYSTRRDLGLVAQQRLGQVLGTDSERAAAQAVVADGKQAVAELVMYGSGVIGSALAQARHQPTYAQRRDVTQQAWLLATEAATTFDPDKGRWTSYLKAYLDATLRPTAARMDTSGTVLPHIRVRVADPDQAAALATLYGNRLRPIIAGDFAQLNERDPNQPPADQQAINRLEQRTVEHLTDKAVRELAALPPLRRDSVTATYLTAETQEDVADRHHVSVRTVRREAIRGLTDLATRLDEPDRPPTLDQRLLRRTHLEQRSPSTSPRPGPGIAR